MKFVADFIVSSVNALEADSNVVKDVNEINVVG